MNGGFLDISSPDDLAAFFGMTYDELAQVVYGMSDSYKYTEFAIPKKNGGSRRIKAPCTRLKSIQRRLADALSEVYSPRPSAHGFLRGRSIVTNARAHVGRNKTFVFNIDLKGYFDAIYFGRVRNLFMARPFSFSIQVATVLAQTCCYQNALPQGAPTSPVVANMISWKLDRQLQNLAKVSRATYTRYADDITFSFTCPKDGLPVDIVTVSDGVALPGAALTELVVDNGFEINHDKVRLAGRSRRMEVTGLTVNEFPNVPRRYVRQIGSILHAWRTHGYEAAQHAFINEYDDRHRASDTPKFLANVVWGRLAFLRSVRGGHDEIFVKLAKQYNELIGGEGPHFRILEPVDPIARAVDSLWVIESEGSDSAQPTQGTGFMLESVGLVTCAHCVVDSNAKPLADLTAFRSTDWSRSFPVQVVVAALHRDIAVCTITPEGGIDPESRAVQLSGVRIIQGLKLTMLGFPHYGFGSSHSIAEVAVTRLFQRFGIQCFAVDLPIAQGNSGGPLLDSDGRVAGMAVLGHKDEKGGDPTNNDPINGVIANEALREFIDTDLKMTLQKGSGVE